MISGRQTLASVVLIVTIGVGLALTRRTGKVPPPAEQVTSSEPTGQYDKSILTNTSQSTIGAPSIGELPYPEGITMPVATNNMVAPHELYLQYVDPAGAGDLVAVSVLVEILGFCQNLGKESYGEYTSYEDVIRNSTLEPELQEWLIERATQCASLVDLVGDTDQERTRLYKIMSKAQHPLILVLQQSVTADEKRDRLLSVILADYPEPFLYERAFMEAAAYHRRYPEHVNVNREYAWFLLGCDVSLSCDRSDLIDHLRAEFHHEYIIQGIEEMEFSIREAIRTKDVQGLGL